MPEEVYVWDMFRFEVLATIGNGSPVKGVEIHCDVTRPNLEELEIPIQLPTVTDLSANDLEEIASNTDIDDIVSGDAAKEIIKKSNIMDDVFTMLSTSAFSLQQGAENMSNLHSVVADPTRIISRANDKGIA